MELLGFENYDDLKEAHCKWADSALQTDNSDKQNKWTQSIAAWPVKCPALFNRVRE